ncbi:winged helix-turn-helix transcriptional regulator [Desulfonauticus submarinus]
MKLLKTLSKKNVKDVLKLLDKYGELQFSEISSILKLHKGNLSTTLRYLEREGIVSRREEKHEKIIPKVYYSLTDYGKKVVKLYDIIDKLEKEKNSSILSIGNNNIIIGSANNTHITLKK